MLTAGRLSRLTLLAALTCTLLGATATGAAADQRMRAALQQEAYYSSYGEPEPIAAPAAPAPVDDTPWLTLTLVAAAALSAVAVAVVLRRRLRPRRTGPKTAFPRA